MNINSENFKQDNLPSKNEFINLYQLSIDLFCIAGFDGYFKKVNPAFIETLGYSEEELLSKPYVEFIHPEDVVDTKNEAGHLESGGDTLKFQNRYICNDGSIKWLSWNCRVDENFIYGVAREITAERETELLLRQNERRLNYLLGNAPVVLFVIDVNGVIVFSSGSALKKIGKKDGEIIGESIYARHANNPILLNAFERARAGNHHTVQVTLSDRIFLIRYSPVMNEDGTVKEVMGVSTDVTDAVNAQSEAAKLQSLLLLESAEKKFRETFDHVGVGMTHTGLDGRFGVVNKEFCRILGRNESEIVGRKFADFTHPDDLELDQKMAAKLLAGEETRARWEKRYLNKKGEVVYVSIVVTVVNDEYNKPSYFIAAQKDITSQKMTEIALKKSDEEFSCLVEAIPKIVWTANAQGERIFWNKRWNDATGLTDEQTKGMGWLQAIHPEDREMTRRLWLDSCKTGKPFYTEHRLQNLNTKQDRWFFVSAVPLVDESGKTIKWYGTAHDIDDYKVLLNEKNRLLANEKSALEASRLKSEFLANMSHEIRTPLTELSGLLIC